MSIPPKRIYCKEEGITFPRFEHFCKDLSNSLASQSTTSERGSCLDILVSITISCIKTNSGAFGTQILDIIGQKKGLFLISIVSIEECKRSLNNHCDTKVLRVVVDGREKVQDSYCW